MVCFWCALYDFFIYISLSLYMLYIYTRIASFCETWKIWGFGTLAWDTR